MLYMVVEHFKNGDAVPIYRRLRARGRQIPPGLEYVSSWVSDDLSRCFQLMETDAPELLDEWTRNWADLGDFDVYAVISSAEAQQRIAGHL